MTAPSGWVNLTRFSKGAAPAKAAQASRHAATRTVPRPLANTVFKMLITGLGFLDSHLVHRDPAPPRGAAARRPAGDEYKTRAGKASVSETPRPRTRTSRNFVRFPRGGGRPRLPHGFATKAAPNQLKAES